MMLEQDTIAAIATGSGGGIGVIRISGPKAFEITGKIFRGRKPISEMKGYTGCLGRTFDADGELDEAVLMVFRAPHSYTGEDVAELSCHGSRFLLERVLAAAVTAGARPAGPGEFTRRAFLNGKMSLTQAEAVADLVSGENRQAARAALEARDGALFRTIQQILASLTDTASHLAAWIDYPEEDVEEVLAGDMSRAIDDARQKLAALTETYQRGRILREGISTAIVGSPNVGKSTLMNLLAGYDRSIVTDIPGTTRDVVEETVRLGGLSLRISDTAGIRSTDDPVEKIGVERSRNRLEQCDLILAVFDGSRPLNDADLELLSQLDGRLAIGICNKADLPSVADRNAIAMHTCSLLTLSARSGDGVQQLEQAISDLSGLSELDSSAGILANQRQLDCTVRAVHALSAALSDLDMGQTWDAVSVSLEEAIGALLELTGQKASEQIIDRVFERFCVGK